MPGIGIMGCRYFAASLSPRLHCLAALAAVDSEKMTRIVAGYAKNKQKALAGAGALSQNIDIGSTA